MKKLTTIFFFIFMSNYSLAQDLEQTKDQALIEKKLQKAQLIAKHKEEIKKIKNHRFKKIAKIQILNKNTAKTQIQEIKTGESFKYGNIIITPHKCWQAPLTQKPDSKILLEVDEIDLKNENEVNNIFLGWMVASSPSISGLEHPIYDITALNCKDE